MTTRIRRLLLALPLLAVAGWWLWPAATPQQTPLARASLLSPPATDLSDLLSAAPLPAVAAGGASASPIVFNGLLVQGSVTKVCLTNPTTGETKWVQVGKSYGNYTVGYEPGLPATKQTPATKDTVLLTLGDKVQRITLKDAKIDTPVVATIPTKIAAEQLQSLYDRLDKAHDDPNPNIQLIQELEQTILQQRVVVMTAIAVDQIDGLERSLDEARMDPNPNPELIQVMEQIRQQQQQGLTTDKDALKIGLSYGYDEASDTHPFEGSGTAITYPDGSVTNVFFDPNGRVSSVEKVSPRNANGQFTFNKIYSAPSPAAAATPPAAAK